MSTLQLHGETIWVVLTDKETHFVLSVNEHRVWDVDAFMKRTREMYPRMHVERVTEEQAHDIKYQAARVHGYKAA